MYGPLPISFVPYLCKQLEIIQLVFLLNQLSQEGTTPSLERKEWRMVSDSLPSELEVDGGIYAISAAHSGRIACAYDSTLPERRDGGQGKRSKIRDQLSPLFSHQLALTTHININFFISLNANSKIFLSNRPPSRLVGPETGYS